MTESKPELSAAPAQENLDRRSRPGRAEWLAVLCLIGLLFGFNIATYDYYPTVWCDEVLFSEPAINLVKHGSFTTTVWEFNPANTFPVVNCPLYPMALVPWLAVTGTTLLAVRCFNYTLMAVGALLIWLASWRLGLVKSAWGRLTMVALLHLGYGMSFSYRCSRPDILGMLCLLLLLFAFTVRNQRRREIYLFLLAAVSVWIGLQVALYAAFASFLAWRLLQQVALRDLIVLALGMLIGASFLVLFLSWHGVLSCFFLSIFGLMGKNYAHSRDLPVGKALLRTILETPRSYVGDFSALVLVLGLFTLLAGTWRRLSIATRRVVLYASSSCLRYPSYSTWSAMTLSTTPTFGLCPPPWPCLPSILSWLRQAHHSSRSANWPSSQPFASAPWWGFPHGWRLCSPLLRDLLVRRLGGLSAPIFFQRMLFSATMLRSSR